MIQVTQQIVPSIILVAGGSTNVIPGSLYNNFLYNLLTFVYFSNLMGTYNNTKHGKGINWDTWHGDKYSLKRAVMMIRSIFNK